MFIGSTQSGLLIIANAAGILNTAASGIPFFCHQCVDSCFLRRFCKCLRAVLGPAFYSDRIGRANAYTINCLISALCLAAMPTVIASQNLILLFIVVGIAYWQYGGGTFLSPSYTGGFLWRKKPGR